MGERLDSTGLTYFWGKIKSYIGGKIIDNLTSTSSTDALSANQGRILNMRATSESVTGEAGNYTFDNIGNGTILICAHGSPGYDNIFFAIAGSTDVSYVLPNTSTVFEFVSLSNKTLTLKKKISGSARISIFRTNE